MPIMEYTIVDNEIFDSYAPIIGPHGIALYCALTRLAYEDRSIYPSSARIGRKAGMSNEEVKSYLPLLTAENKDFSMNDLSPLVSIETRHRQDGEEVSHLYTLLPISIKT